MLAASLSLAHTQLVGQRSEEASLDARTMGMLGFTSALLAADIAAKDLLGVAWWTPLVAIGIAIACCLSPALGIGFGFSHNTDFGPDPFAFYTDYARRLSTLAREQLLTDVVAAFAGNTRRLRAKQRALRASIVVLAVGVAASTVVVGLDRPSTVRGIHALQHART